MSKFAGIVAGWMVPLALCAPSMQAQTSVREVRVLDSKGAVEIEIETSDRIAPQTQVLTAPDRLVIDFPNAVPGTKLRSQSVYRAEVKDVRVGLFQANPPVTRVVLDLKSAQSYQVFPYGRTVMIKVMGGGQDDSIEANDSPAPTSRPGLVVANYTTGAERIHEDGPSRQVLDVSFRGGMLSIKSNKATLSEVLFAVQQRTGAEVAIAPGAELERVAADLGPGPAPEVLSALLNGSKFNFMILSAVDNPQTLERVILSPRNESVVVAPTVSAQNSAQNDAADEDEPPPPPPAVRTPPTNNPPPISSAPNQPAEPRTPPDENAPQPQ
jgi:AMIN domain